VAKNFKAALVYRWIDKYQDDNSYSFRHRLMLDLTAKHKFGNATISYRNRTQVEVRDIYSSAAGAVPEWYSRNKFGVKYDLGKRYTPYASVEFRYQFHDPRNIESDGTWHRDRYVLGMDYELNKKSTFGVYYLIQREYQVVSPQDMFIVGLEYSHSL
jgi:predicted porin